MPKIIKLSVLQKRAKQRIMRDLKELHQSNIESISAKPMNDNIFEFHVNIKPTTGVYSGVYFHLIMTFPPQYPDIPPKIKICTPINHPNIFGGFLCLSMLRTYTSKIPYEGWSSAYTITSVLMQLQSFLFAEKIDQDGGYTRDARLSDRDVKDSLKVCKEFKCKKCGHSHSKPFPAVKGPGESLVKVLPLSKEVFVQNSACQTTHTYWVGAYGNFGCNFGKIMYEVFVNWTGDKWAVNNIRGGLCRFGWGTANANVCGKDIQSFGYGGTGFFSHNNNFMKFGEKFTKDDTITCAIDFDTGRIYFGKNGRILEPDHEMYIPDYIWNSGEQLYPILSFKNSRAEFNFSKCNKPIKYLINNGFKTLEQVAMDQIQGESGQMDDDDSKWDSNTAVDWIDSEGIIDPFWIIVFEHLDFYSVYRSQIVCKKFCKIITHYNLLERNEMKCFYTKLDIYHKKICLGIGLHVRSGDNNRVIVSSQYDIVSLEGYNNGNYTSNKTYPVGVWGEPISHFLPLVINRDHINRNRKELAHRLNLLAKTGLTNVPSWYKPNYFDQQIKKNNMLRYADLLIEMMNNIVVQLVKNEDVDPKKGVKLQFCEKALIGYCSFHHILLYLCKYNNKIKAFANSMIESFNKKGHIKSYCKDLGKLLIYLMISDYDWKKIAKTFILECFTRNVKWYCNDVPKLNNIYKVHDRLSLTFKHTGTSRKLVLFQIWFLKNCRNVTFKDYNDKLGRPSVYMRTRLQAATKKILSLKSWKNYFKGCNILISKDPKDFHKELHALLQWSVKNSAALGYHTIYKNKTNGIKQSIKLPKIVYFNPSQPGSKNTFDDFSDGEDAEELNEAPVYNNRGKQAGFRGRISLNGNRGRGRNRTTLNSNNNGNAWNRGRGRNNTRGRGRGRGRGRNRGRGRGFNRGY